MPDGLSVTSSVSFSTLPKKYWIKSSIITGLELIKKYPNYHIFKHLNVNFFTIFDIVEDIYFAERVFVTAS